MGLFSYPSFPDATDLLPNDYSYEEMDDMKDDLDESEMFDDDIYDLDELEEVFNDHLFMSKRLRKTLYAGDFDDLKDFPDHPPIALTGLALELFSKAAPNYGLDILDMDYIASTSEAVKISPCAMIVALIYLERLQIKNCDYLETVSPSGLFVVTMLVASKFLFENEEDIVSNSLWAEALNIDVKELNNLEQEFLSAIDWKLLVDSSAYFQHLCKIEQTIAVRESSLRGWLSYSDINAIIQDTAFQGFWLSCIENIVKVTVLSTLGYIATAFALYGSMVTIQKVSKEPKNYSQDSANSSVLPIPVSLHNLRQPHTSDDLSENYEQLHSALSSIQKSKLELSDQNGDAISWPQDRVMSYVCSSLYVRQASFRRIVPRESHIYSSSKLKTNSSPPLLDSVVKNELLFINHTYYNNLYRMEAQKNCISVLIR